MSESSEADETPLGPQSELGKHHWVRIPLPAPAISLRRVGARFYAAGVNVNIKLLANAVLLDPLRTDFSLKNYEPV